MTAGWRTGGRAESRMSWRSSRGNDINEEDMTGQICVRVLVGAFECLDEL